MVYLLIHQQAKSFPEFKKIWDREAVPFFEKWGCVNARLCQSPNNPEDILVIHAFENIESAQKFMTSDDLKEKLQTAGVSGSVEMTLFNSVDYKDLLGARKGTAAA